MQKSKEITPITAAWAFDSRVVQRNLNEGLISPADVKSFIDGLPDVGSKGDMVRTTRPGQGGDNDGDDDLEERE